MTIKPAEDHQIRDWRAATASPLPDARWSDFVVGALIARIDEDRERAVRRILESDRWQAIAEQRVYVRQELADILGTEDVDEAVRLIKAWKGAAMMAAGQVMP